ncbi:MAG: histidine--tRNA ligase [Bacillota bacterium]|jgi:histidyl-tRNA synthetase
MLTNAPRGTQDVLPGLVEKFQYVEDIYRRLCHLRSFREIRTPMFEHSELFHRAVGEQTDIVQKETYTFLDRGQRSLTLRAEGTAPVVRAFVEHGIYAQAQPTKYFYIAQIFRYEKPQQGRLRQHQQCGAEIFGTHHPHADVEVISLADQFYRQLGLRQFTLEISSIGCPSCRPAYREQLSAFLASRLENLCADCQQRYQHNPLRIFDCKDESCQRQLVDAPTPLSAICPDCAEHYRAVKAGLDALGIPYQENPRLVRGLDYYTNTAFEFHSDLIGAQSAIGGGGRYDGLVEEVGGPATPGVGFGIGTERLILALEAEGVALPGPAPLDVYLATLGDAADLQALALLQELRQAGLVAEKDLLGRSLKAQMKQAGRAGARYTVVIGDDELARGVGLLRDMESGQQEEVPLGELVARLAR